MHQRLRDRRTSGRRNVQTVHHTRPGRQPELIVFLPVGRLRGAQILRREELPVDEVGVPDAFGESWFQELDLAHEDLL